MNEQSKATMRRVFDSSYQYNRVFSGRGIDIGAGSDSLRKAMNYFPGITSVLDWDVQNGDAQEIQCDKVFDFVHSSHCLEHMRDPHVAIANWIACARIGGYIIFTVPDEEMYERFNWPSKFNPDHKWSFTLDEPKLPKSIRIQDFLATIRGVSIESVKRITANFDPSKPNHVDQTLGPAECAIEVILKRTA